MKDYYDVYYFLTKLRPEIKQAIFKEALSNTIAQRESTKYLEDYRQILDEIAINERMHTYWKSYKNKNKYAKDIEFGKIIDLLKSFLR